MAAGAEPRPTRLCAVCGLAVGTYEPSVFVFPDEVIHASRAARPGLAAEPDCRLMHRDCFSAQAPVPHLRLVTD